MVYSAPPSPPHPLWAVPAALAPPCGWTGALPPGRTQWYSPPRPPLHNGPALGPPSHSALWVGPAAPRTRDGAVQPRPGGEERGWNGQAREAREWHCPARVRGREAPCAPLLPSLHVPAPSLPIPAPSLSITAHPCPSTAPSLPIIAPSLLPTYVSGGRKTTPKPHPTPTPSPTGTQLPPGVSPAVPPRSWGCRGVAGTKPVTLNTPARRY